MRIPFLASLVISGFVLKKGETREVDTPSAWKGRIWGRSRCSNNSTGSFSCQTGDCGSGKIECSGKAGTRPVTLAEFNFNDSQSLDDNYHVSLVEGYNLPLLIAPHNELTCTGCVPDPNIVICVDSENLDCTNSTGYNITFCPSRVPTTRTTK